MSDLYLVSWNITSRCDLRCAHCYLDASAVPSADELLTAEGDALIDDLAALAPGAMLVLSGGEPLLRSDVLNLGVHAVQRGLTVVLGTNGILLDDALAQELARLGVAGVGISLDSLDATRHDAFRGVAGAWARAVRGLDAARRAGLAAQIQTTVTRENYDEIPALVAWAAREGARAFNLFFLVCTGRGQKMSDISPAQYESLLQWLATTNGNHNGMMLRARCAPHFRRVVAQRDPRSPLLVEDASACLAGTHYARILPNGDVTPCPYLPLAAGNVRETPFSVLWNSAPLFHALRAPKLAGRCGECEFATTCGGCRARAFATSGDYWNEDPWCAYQPGQTRPVALTPIAWTPEAQARMERVPAFLRGMVRKRLEARARERGMDCVTVELIRELRESVSSIYSGTT